MPVISRKLAVVPLLLLLGACTTIPTGPSVMVLPGTGRSIESFRADDVWCRDDAMRMIGGKSATQARQESALTSAAVGTAVGALAGAAIGGDSRGAGVGAGVGLLAGTAAGADASRSSGIGTQRQYDNAYIQCMYAKGHRVPVAGNMTYSRPVSADEAKIPAPPSGKPPAPPPGVR
ncbi:MAG: YMGG-like glycine zipper-containing protein [Azonexaceae bacterium]|uniref:YMGG-like glycine zipper-containing protein n=1 Tax=Azonexus sp. R2A61 TaxID=2744443 RepID=UPI001F448D2E|nr:YMGG-like glycine zipper-containing protein [Azonexus sp. R2A61]MCE1241366.1 YMGG-like glycine zipper-containing protein [Azonexaceae bacterium]